MSGAEAGIYAGPGSSVTYGVTFDVGSDVVVDGETREGGHVNIIVIQSNPM